MDAAPAREIQPEPSAAASSAEGEPPEATAQGPAAPAPASVDIHGAKVLVSELVKHFDPACPEKCDEGSLKVGRPLPRGFKGVMWVRELCACTVRGYVAQHPPTAVPPPDPVVGARARAALAGAPPAPRPERGTKRLAVLETELARERRALEDLRAGTGTRVAPVAESLAALDAEEVAAARARASAEGTKVYVTAELEQMRARVSGLQAEFHAANERLAAADLERGAFARRRTDLEEKLAAERARVAPAEAAAEKRIEKLARRAATVRAYNPALPAPPEAENDRG